MNRIDVDTLTWRNKITQDNLVFGYVEELECWVMKEKQHKESEKNE